MKPFRFSLERVLGWRRTQLSLEEAKMERLQSELTVSEQARLQLPVRLHVLAERISTASDLRGAQLAELEAFRVWTVREDQRIAAWILKLRQSIAVQARAVTEARMRLRLIGRLKENRHAAWQAECDKELEEFASEFVVSRWTRRGKLAESGRYGEMLNLPASSLNGMEASTACFDATARRIAARAASEAPVDTLDLSALAVALKSGEAQFEVSAKFMREADDLAKTTLKL
jgi:DNA polymerase III psi subunit